MYSLEVNYTVGEAFEANLLNGYKSYLSKIESGFFTLCIKGTIQAIINDSPHNIGEGTLPTLPPNHIMEIQEFSLDTRIYYVGFSPLLIEDISLMKVAQHLLPTMTKDPVVILSPLQACSYKIFYESLILSYTSSIAQAGKEITKATLTMFLQGSTEIYKLQNKWYLSFQLREYEICQEFL